MAIETHSWYPLVPIKLLHTVAWLFLGCILAIPVAGTRDEFRRATALRGPYLSSAQSSCSITAAAR
jgi:hypothetical protein